jgi:transcriptional regulator with XRE-family HTH domain
MELEHVGPALRRLRQLRGLKQVQVAARSGCSKAQVSAYERGKRLPRVDTLFRLLDAMGCRARDFGRAVEYVERNPPAE